MVGKAQLCEDFAKTQYIKAVVALLSTEAFPEDIVFCIAQFLKIPRVYGWGANTFGQLCGSNDVVTVPSLLHENFLESVRIAHVTAGGDFTLALSDKGQVYAWGRNKFGQLGIPDIPEIGIKTPTQVPHLKDVVISQLHCRYAHALALTDKGCVYAWGRNDYAQLGLGHRSPCGIPTRLDSLQHVRVLMISAGGFHSICATDTEVYVWGWNGHRQIGLPNPETTIQTTPIVVPTLPPGLRIKQISAGGHHNLVLTDKGVYSWGYSEYGQTSHQGANHAPALITSLEGISIAHLETGYNHSFVLTETGELYCFGRNHSGQLGLGHDNHQSVPVVNPFFSSHQIRTISSGRHCSIILTHGGEIYVFGELGTDKWCSPTLVTALSGVKVSHVFAGFNNMFAFAKT